jgi:hypothetical protein
LELSLLLVIFLSKECAAGWMEFDSKTIRKLRKNAVFPEPFTIDRLGKVCSPTSFWEGRFSKARFTFRVFMFFSSWVAVPEREFALKNIHGSKKKILKSPKE